MRRGIGTIVTTGVALVGAAVVVANPVMAPPSDVRVPAVELSGAAASAGALDQTFVNALASDPSDSGPVTALKRLLAQLVTEATLFGGEAVKEAFQAQDIVLAPPALTAASLPYLSPAAGPADLPGAISSPPTPGPTVVAADVEPVLRETLTALAEDVTFVGRQVIAAAVVAGTLGQSESRLMVAALTALANGALRTAIDTTPQVVTAPLGPPMSIVDAIRTVVGKRLGAQYYPPAAAAAESAPAPAATPAPVAGPAQRPRPAASPVRRSTAATLRSGTADHQADGTEVAQRSAARPPRVRDNVAAAVDSVRTAVASFGAAAPNAVAPHSRPGAAASARN